MEVRRSNVLRVSHRSCDECTTLEDLYAANRLVFVLFYERQLVGHHKYKGAIIGGFHETCAELRFSHVACGAVDMLEDKAYALKYIDPQTAPAHIVVRDGQPIATTKRHITRLMERPGDKETILWHLGDMLAADASPLSLHISAEAKDAAALGRFLQRHATTIVIAGPSSAASSVRAAAQRLVFEGHVPDAVGASRAKGGKGQAVKQQPGHKSLFFVVASGAQTLKAHNLTEGSVYAFAGEKRLLYPVQDMAKKFRSEDQAVEILLPIVQSVLQAKPAAEGEAPLAKPPNTAGAAAGQPVDMPAHEQRRGKGGASGKRGARRSAKDAEL